MPFCAPINCFRPLEASGGWSDGAGLPRRPAPRFFWGGGVAMATLYCTFRIIRRETSGADQIYILFFFFFSPSPTEQTYQSPNFLPIYNPNVPLGETMRRRVRPICFNLILLTGKLNQAGNYGGAPRGVPEERKRTCTDFAALRGRGHRDLKVLALANGYRKALLASSQSFRGGRKKKKSFCSYSV